MKLPNNLEEFCKKKGFNLVFIFNFIFNFIFIFIHKGIKYPK